MSKLASLQLIRVGNVNYHATQMPTHRLVQLDEHENNTETGPALCTVIIIEHHAEVIFQLLQATVNRYSEMDDVWSTAFLECIIFAGSNLPQSEGPILNLAKAKMYGVENIYTSTSIFQNDPYLLLNNSLHRVYRLYPDTVALFIMSTIQTSHNSDVYQTLAWIGSGFFFYDISPYAQAPEMILPIGQTRYHSRVTDSGEWLPVSIGIIAAQNDIFLAEVVQEMYRSTGTNTTVMTGKTAFEVLLAESETTKSLGGSSKLKHWGQSVLSEPRPDL
ncbi:hypothetical protein LZ554_004519 [Drepanopeziza brunnea f. sp. 'monogermtubi']|nr:hypothetical protein LZ554_004519 [Drepanopeziza brunnea f. sp. 'monogermtubi']